MPDRPMFGQRLFVPSMRFHIRHPDSKSYFGILEVVSNLQRMVNLQFAPSPPVSAGVVCTCLHTTPVPSNAPADEIDGENDVDLQKENIFIKRKKAEY